LIDGIALRVSWLTLVPWSSTTQIKIGFLGGRPSDCASYDDGRVFRVSGAGTGTSRSVVGGSRMAKYEGRQIGTIFGWIDSTSTSVHCWYFRIANAHATTPYLYKQTWFRLWWHHQQLGCLWYWFDLPVANPNHLDWHSRDCRDLRHTKTAQPMNTRW